MLTFAWPLLGISSSSLNENQLVVSFGLVMLEEKMIQVLNLNQSLLAYGLSMIDSLIGTFIFNTRKST